MARTNMFLNYDQSNQVLVSNASSVWVTSSLMPELNRNDQYLLDLTVYSDPPTTANLASINTSSFILTIGGLGADPVLTMDDATFDATNAASGEISCEINTHSANLTAAITTSTVKNYYALIAGTDNAIGCSQVIAQFPVKIRNVVGTGSTC